MNRKQIIHEFTNETNFSRYIDLLSKYGKNFLIIVASNDTPCGSVQFTADVAVKLMRVGFGIPLHNKPRCSYAAVRDSSTGGSVLVFEGWSQTHPVNCEFELEGVSVKVESLAYGVKGGVRGSKIILNGEDRVVGGRGLGFVVFDKTTGDLIDSVRFDTYAPEIVCYRKSESPIRKQFMERHPGVTFILPQYPAFPQNNLSKYEEFVINNHISYSAIKAKADTLRTPLNDYIDSPDGIREVLSSPTAYIGTDGARHLRDCSGKYFNTVNGHRITTNQPDHPERIIYTVGGCGILGIGVRDCGTLASQLQMILNEQVPEYRFSVENYGFFLDGVNPEKEMTSVLEALPLKPGDIVVGYGGIKTETAEFSRPQDGRELFFDNLQHVTEKCHQLVAFEVFKTLKKHNFFQKTLHENHKIAAPCSNSRQADYGLLPEQREKLEEYKSTLAHFFRQQLRNLRGEPKVGTIVMNCNPFTIGHRYLIEQCAAKVDFLVVFVVQEDRSYFPFEDRIDLVDKGTEDIANVGIIESGNFIISELTFSEYFNKSELQDTVVDSSKDVTLFAREIAPAMHISVRFAGSEPFDKVTRQYNQMLGRILPLYGVEFVEIPRLVIEGETVSASRVRELLAQKDWAAIERLVPAATLEYLQKKYS